MNMEVIHRQDTQKKVIFLFFSKISKQFINTNRNIPCIVKDNEDVVI
jgi:hypothetical protein